MVTVEKWSQQEEDGEGFGRFSYNYVI